MKTFAEKVIAFNLQLDFKGTLPEDIHIMNPFRENPDILPVIKQFYRKFYRDMRLRHIILGINPGRHGAGVTGIPFTDTKRLQSECHIPYTGASTHEPSSTFVYRVIDAYGGVERFYSDFYINAICPLGFTKGGKNYNYYDSKALMSAVKDFILECLTTQLAFGIERDVCFCLGTGKNFKFLDDLNKEHHFFDKIIPLDHPRFVVQYKSKSIQVYEDKYLRKLKKALHPAKSKSG